MYRKDEEYTLNWLESLCVNVLRAGTIPRHVALILDGNRRYARKNHLQFNYEGHVHGFKKLTEVLQWCEFLGIEEVTVYVFSIENFKRSADEVRCLMELARDKFKEMLEEMDRIMEKNICIRVIGDFSRLPTDIQQMAARVILTTRNNTKSYLNVALSYTFRNEVTHVVNDIADGVNSGHLSDNDVTEGLFNECLRGHGPSDVDLLIRTSGELRMSDFLLWQCAYSTLVVVDVLWPEFTISKLFTAVLYYQIQQCKLKVLNGTISRLKMSTPSVENRKLSGCESVAKRNEPARFSDNCVDERSRRVDSFLTRLADKRLTSLIEIRDGLTLGSKPVNGKIMPRTS